MRLTYHCLLMVDSSSFLQSGIATGKAAGGMDASTAPAQTQDGARGGQVVLCCQFTDYCLTSEALVALQSQMLLHCTCVIAVTLRIVALKGKVLTMLELVVAYQCVTVVLCCRLAQQLVSRPLPQPNCKHVRVQEWDR